MSSINHENKYVRRERNKTHGAGLARNTAMCKQRTLIAFSDADCLVDPQWLAVIAQEILVRGKTVLGGAVASDQVLDFFPGAMHCWASCVTANMAFDSKKTGATSFDESFQDFLCRTLILSTVFRIVDLYSIMCQEMKVMHPAKILWCEANGKARLIHAEMKSSSIKNMARVLKYRCIVLFRPTLVGTFPCCSLAVF